MDLVYKKFKELSPGELQDALRLRQQVFVIEQKCFYEDIDGKDPEAEHLLIYDGDDLAAYLRIFQAGTKYPDQSNMGRIVVNRAYRGSDTGPLLIREGLKRCRTKPVRIEAQAELIEYYNRYGFKEEGEIYVVDDIDHIQMVYSG